MIDVLLVAASGLAREVIAMRPLGARFVGVLDDNPRLRGTNLYGVPVVGGLERATDFPGAQLTVCAGKGSARRGLVRRLAEFGIGERDYVSLLARDAHVPAGCAIRSGSIVLPRSVLTASVTVGHHVVVMPNVTLTHDDVIEDFATICAGVALGGSVHVGEAAYLGMNSSVRERITVGAEATLGMGGVLIRDLPPGQTWAGVPAKPVPSSVEVMI
jgi:sugar O-acyltransferase (sialic acid O-acetyltransferase NeuD family)